MCSLPMARGHEKTKIGNLRNNRAVRIAYAHIVRRPSGNELCVFPWQLQVFNKSSKKKGVYINRQVNN